MCRLHHQLCVCEPCQLDPRTLCTVITLRDSESAVSPCQHVGLPVHGCVSFRMPEREERRRVSSLSPGACVCNYASVLRVFLREHTYSLSPDHVAGATLHFLAPLGPCVVLVRDCDCDFAGSDLRGRERSCVVTATLTKVSEML